MRLMGRVAFPEGQQPAAGPVHRDNCRNRARQGGRTYVL